MTVADKQIPEILPSPYVAGLLCRCPRCGKGRLFDGFLTLRSSCEACGQDFAFADAGDGPAIFVIMIAGAIMVGAALVTEVKYQPPFWVGPCIAVGAIDIGGDALAAQRTQEPSHRVAVSSQGVGRAAPVESRRVII